MFSFFRRFDDVRVETKVAADKAEFFRAELESAKEEIALLRKKLEAETRANRKREDSLIESFLSLLADGKRFMMPAPRYETPETETADELSPEQIEFNALVEQRVTDLIEDGKNSGRTYDEAEIILLRDNIAANPEYFGIPKNY